MPIAALPTNTIRAIGSAQTLTDSASLVKELVDNAIDGRASSICIEISANLLDDIRVKDNGHGIAPKDRAMLCQRYCTSKIRDLNDLRDIGGRSLGFRGEALASAAEMSGCLTIATRIEGEETASEVKLDRHGHVTSEKRLSLPVGTTVRVERFLATLPVRRQTAEKTSAKVLLKVKRLLLAYVLARPYLRLSLRILKAKNDRDNWKYAGVGHLKTVASAFDAARETIGKKVTDQCQWTCSRWSSAGQQADVNSGILPLDASHKEVYIFEALLAKPECDTALINNIGQYLSVDSRPVSCTKGTFKQIVGIYKSYVRSLKGIRDNAKVVDPFLRMNIVCPVGTYDANVEPAKDDVLFGDPDLILRLVEDYFRSIYGELISTSSASIPPESSHSPQDFDLLLAKKTPSNGNTFRGLAPIVPPATPGRSSAKTSTLQQRISDTAPIPNDSQSEPRARLQPAQDMFPGVRSHRHLVNEAVDESKALGEPSSMRAPDEDHYLLPSSPEGNLNSPLISSTWRPSMYADDEDDIVELDVAQGQQATPAREDDSDEDSLRNVGLYNPWTLAKLNAPSRPSGRNPQPTGSVESNGQLPTPRRQQGDAGTITGPSSDDLLHYSGPSMRGKMRRRTLSRSPPNDGLPSPPSLFPFPLRARGNSQSGCLARRGAGLNRSRNAKGCLDTWVQRSNSDNGEVDNMGTESGMIDSSLDPSHPQLQRDFVSARTLPMGTPLSDIPDVSQRPRRKPGAWKQQRASLNKPSVSPVNDPERVWFDIGEQAQRRQAPQARPRVTLRDATAAKTLMLQDNEDEISSIPPPIDDSTRPMHPDLVIALDYETRKQKAIDHRRELLRQQAAAEKRNSRELANAFAETSTNTIPTTSPHKNRQSKAIAALHTNNDSPTAAIELPEHHQPAFKADDPRAYLLRMQQDEEAGPTASRLKRTKTTTLPFETLHQDTYTGNLTLRLEYTIPAISSQTIKTRPHDEYIASGKDLAAFSSPTSQQIQDWEERLKRMVKASYRIEGMAPEEEMDGDLDVDLMAVWRDHVARTVDLTVS